MKRLNLHLTKQQIIRSSIYALWYLFAVILSVMNFIVMWGPNTQGDSCDTSLWQYGRVYSWFDGRSCVFTDEFYLAIHISYTIIYVLFDYVRRKILGRNPSVLWRFTELFVLFIICWLSIIISPYSLTIYVTAFLGSLQFFAPFFILAMGLKFVGHK